MFIDEVPDIDAPAPHFHPRTAPRDPRTYVNATSEGDSHPDTPHSPDSTTTDSIPDLEGLTMFDDDDAIVVAFPEHSTAPHNTPTDPTPALPTVIAHAIPSDAGAAPCDDEL